MENATFVVERESSISVTLYLLSRSTVVLLNSYGVLKNTLPYIGYIRGSSTITETEEYKQLTDNILAN